MPNNDATLEGLHALAERESLREPMSEVPHDAIRGTLAHLVPLGATMQPTAQGLIDMALVEDRR